MFLKNSWYVACTLDEFAEKLLGRKNYGHSRVLCRDPEGKVAAVENPLATPGELPKPDQFILGRFDLV